MTGAQIIEIKEGTMTCRVCKQVKLFSEFNRNYNYKSGRLSKCKACVREYLAKNDLSKNIQKRFRDNLKKNPEKYAKYLAKKTAWNKSDKYYESYYKKRFGISYQSVVSMLRDQHGLCANIGCSRPISLTKSENHVKAVVDHCHSTGKVRSLLCVRCNGMLGHIENNVNLIPGFLDYLNKYR